MLRSSLFQLSGSYPSLLGPTLGVVFILLLVKDNLPDEVRLGVCAVRVLPSATPAAILGILRLAPRKNFVAQFRAACVPEIVAKNPV